MERTLLAAHSICSLNLMLLLHVDWQDVQSRKHIISCVFDAHVILGTVTPITKSKFGYGTNSSNGGERTIEADLLKQQVKPLAKTLNKFRDYSL